VADAYDAMISDRPYRNAISPEKAVEELKRFAGIQFDPELVKKFIETVKEK
jgi:HD-GYP domain-containing protein (c-di-GMP phosphodiesterase class II)